MKIFTLSSYFVLITSLLISFFVFSKFKENRKNFIFGWFCFIVAIWGLGGIGFSTVVNKKDAFFWWQVAYVGVVFSPAVYTHFVFEYLKIPERKFVIFCYTLAILFFYFVVFHKELFFGDLKFVYNEYYSVDWLRYKSPIMLLMYVLFYWFLLLFSFSLLLRKLAILQGVKKNQLFYLILGSLCGWLGPHPQFLSYFGIDIYPYSNFLIAIYPIVIAYAIIRYRLMDISVAITRTGIFVFVYSVILGLPLLIIYYLQNELVSLLGLSWWIIPFLCSTALATLGPFIYIYIDKKAEDRLLREQRAYQNILRNASSGMIRVKELKKLLNLVVRVVTKAVRIKYASIYLLSKEADSFVLQSARYANDVMRNLKIVNFDSFLISRLISNKKPIVTEEMVMMLRDESQNYELSKLTDQLIKLNAALVVPSFVEDRLIGILVLGEKVSGKLYSEDDLAVFSVLANQLAISVENVLYYEELINVKSKLVHLEKLAAMGRLAHVVAHEINNPLSAIKTFTEHLEENYDNQEYRTNFKKIVGSEIERISSIVYQLYDLAKPRIPRFQKNVDMHNLLDSQIVLLEQELRKNEIALIKNYEPRGVFLEVDPDQMKQCFLNLIINAIQSFEDNKKNREIIISTRISKERQFCVNIVDTGKGISLDDMPRILEPFFTTKNYGQGVGLAVVSNIIKSHNGEIKVESKFGEGTVFTIELPFKMQVV